MSVDPELLDRALTHRSFAYERGGLPTNERLEFLGDSVLGLLVTEHLFVSYPDLSEVSSPNCGLRSSIPGHWRMWLVTSI